MNSNLYVIKEYYKYPEDIRNRASTEYAALKFLSKYSVTQIPKVVGIDKKYKWLAMEFISGKKIELNSLSEEIIDQCVKFILQIQRLRDKPDVNIIGSASEAVFSLTDCFNYLDIRLNRLIRINIKNKIDRECRDFIKEKFFKTYYYFSNFAKKKYKSEGLDENKKIDKRDRFLSQSDFGFHNSILRENGELCFIDFEYFGWDDPAKLISDFFLQPDFPLPYIYRKKVVSKLEKYVRDKRSLKVRLPVYYLLCGLKWSLILLNPFVRNGYDKSVKMYRLKKSQLFLNHLMEEYADKVFPISLI